MPIKSPLRTLIESHHVNVSERLHKSARQYFCHIFGSLLKQFSSKNFLLVVSEIMRLFVNILAPIDKHSVSVKASV